jgi:two-component system sensor histidine kinase PilS (NtrC family)
MSQKDRPGAHAGFFTGFGALRADEAEYARGILYLMWGRVTFLLLFLASVAVFNFSSIIPPSAPEIRALIATVLVYLGLSALYFITYYTIIIKARGRLFWFALAQIVFDLPLWTVLVALTGGPDSFFVFLFHISIMIGAVYCGARGIVFSLILGICLYVLMALAEPAGLVPPRLEPFVVIVQREPAELVYRVGIDVGSMVLVAFFTGLLVLRVSVVGEKLRKTEAIFKDLDRLNEAIISLVPSGLITVDNAGQIRTLNRQAAGILGFEGDTWQDTNITRLVDLSVDELSQPRLSKEVVIPGPGGKKIYECSVSALLNARGERIGGVIHMLDITRMLEMQRDLARMERVSALANLAVGLAHEIRNPLGSISGSVEMIMKGPAFSEDDKKLLGIVAKEVRRIDNLVTSLMNLSRQEEELNRSTFKLDGLVDETISIFRASEQSSHVDFQSRIPSEVAVDADRDKIGQVLLNLIKNGAEAMAGQQGGRITLEAEDTGNGKVEVRVADEGSGIGAAEVEKIFEHYFTTKNWGIGVGLSVSRHIMQKHGETLGYRPGKDRGSIFYFTLKRA